MKRVLNYIIVCAVVSVVLSSCAVGKKYQRPDLATPDTYRTTMALTGDTVLLPWRAFLRTSNW